MSFNFNDALKKRKEQSGENKKQPENENQVAPPSIDIRTSSPSSDAVLERMESDRITDYVVDLSMDQVIPDPEQPRTVFEKIEERAASIKTHKQTTPIEVRSVENGKYMIIDGECRYRAKLLLAEQEPSETIHKTIKAIVISEGVATEEERLTRQLITFIHKENIPQMDLAKAYENLKNLKGFKTDIELAGFLHKSKGHVSKVMKLLKLSPEEQALIESGQISVREVQESSGKEAIKNVVKKEAGKKVERVAKLSIPLDSAKQIVLLMQNLAEKNNLSPILVEGEPTKKELLAIIETRMADITEKVLD